ncbi:hypothetical protein BGZ72_006714 [Mortierella alpina]|nr:hypothetical protein BGZ72_006714 [Mortierella alpina]
MIVEPRFTAILLILTAGGVLFTASRYRSDPQHGPDSLESVRFGSNHELGPDNLEAYYKNYEEDLGAADAGYNYCQAQRPSVTTYPSPKVQGSTLVHSQLIVRHGDRTPVRFLPLDADISWDCSNTSAYFFSAPGIQPGDAPLQYANVLGHQIVSIPPTSPFAAQMWKGNCIPGQLTSVGAMQHRRLGAALRQIYVGKFNLLPEIYDPEIVHIRSTDRWRTKQSAENFMAGMYGIPGQSTRSLLPVLQIFTLPEEIDYLTMNHAMCPRLGHLFSVAEKSSEVLKKLEKDTNDFDQELSAILGEKKQGHVFMDTVLPRVCHDKPLQCRKVEGVEKCVDSSIKERILENVDIYTTEAYRDMNGAFEVLQLGIGPLTNEIKQNLLTAKDNGKVRFHLYSGHDTTIVPLLGMLNAEDMRWPPYASNMLMELWKTPEGSHFVRVLYNNVVLKTVSDWCNLEWCPLDTFVNYLDRFIVKDLTKECQL